MDLFFTDNLIGIVSTCIFVGLSHDRFLLVLRDVTMKRRHGSQLDYKHFVVKVATNEILNKSTKDLITE